MSRLVLNTNWEDFDFCVRHLLDDIRIAETPVSHVLAIARGGSFLGGALSYGLDVPMTMINFVDLDDMKKILLYTRVIPHLLIVDDRYHTGKTIDHIVQALPETNNKVSVAVWHKSRDCIGNIYHTEFVSPEIWVNYPWDNYRN